jgi:flagellar basal body-associated protein FliL
MYRRAVFVLGRHARRTKRNGSIVVVVMVMIVVMMPTLVVMMVMILDELNALIDSVRLLRVGDP